MITFTDILIQIFNVAVLFVMVAGGLALFVLIFMVLLKANKLLQLRINQETTDNDQKPATF